MAEESGDGDKVKVIQDELNELEERAEALDRQRTKNISAIRFASYTYYSLISLLSVGLTCFSYIIQGSTVKECFYVFVLCTFTYNG